MAIQLLPQLPSTGQRAGEAFGGGIASALNMLAQNKMQQMQQRQQASKMSNALKSLNLPQELSGLPENVLNTVIGSHFKQQIAQQKAAQDYLKEYGFLPESASTSRAPSIQDVLSQSMQQRAPMNQQGALQNTLSGGLNPEQAIRELAQETQPEQKAIPLTKQSLIQQTEQMKTAAPWQILQMEPRGKQQVELFKEARKQQDKIDKTLDKRIEKLDNAHQAFIKDKYSFNTLRKAVNSGKLTSAGWARFRHAFDQNRKAIGAGLGGALGTVIGAWTGSTLPGVGTVGGALTGSSTGSALGAAAAGIIPEFVGSPLDQAFNKTVYGFMKNAKDIFGSRIPVAEMEMFLQTLPTLRMDDSAKLAIIDQMEAMGKLAEAQYNAKNEILKKHGGHAPANLFELINEKTQPMMDSIAADLTKTIDRLINELNVPTKHINPMMSI